MVLRNYSSALMYVCSLVGVSRGGAKRTYVVTAYSSLFLSTIVDLCILFHFACHSVRMMEAASGLVISCFHVANIVFSTPGTRDPEIKTDQLMGSILASSGNVFVVIITCTHVYALHHVVIRSHIRCHNKFVCSVRPVLLTMC